MDGDIALTLTTKPAAQRARGAVILGFRHDATRGVTGLSYLYHSHPMRVLFPRPARNDVITAAITTVSGGNVGGDQIDASISAEENAHVLSLALAAEKVYQAPDVKPP